MFVDAKILNRCVWLNAGAIGFSLAHIIGDTSIVLPPAVSVSIVAPLSGIVYGWWALSMVRAASGRKSALISLLLLSVLWAGINGATIVYCLPSCAYNPLADIIHLGSLLFGLFAGLAAWQVMRESRAAKS